jgi:hypothetical protein
MKFTHKPETGGRILVETTAVTLSEVIAAFEGFLRGCGYYFKGNLEIVEPEDE